MQRIVIFSRGQLSHLPSMKLSAAGVRGIRQIPFPSRSVHDKAADTKRVAAADIKKNVPELWVRKMKTFFAAYDLTGDGVIDIEDYKRFTGIWTSNAVSKNASKERIEEFSEKFYKFWLEEVVRDNEKFKWTENILIEDMFELVSRPGSEKFLRDSGKVLFNLFDLNGDGYISKGELKTIFGENPFTIVSFSGMDTNRNGEVSEEEFLQAYLDFFCNFADETNPSKHFMGPLVKM